jgi:aminoglycoside N3'-acetyltransferase
MVIESDIVQGLKTLGLKSSSSVIVHSSLRSFVPSLLRNDLPIDKELGTISETMRRAFLHICSSHPLSIHDT